MLHDERDFRAIIFSFPDLNSLGSVETLLASNFAPLRPKRAAIPTEDPAIEAIRTTYYSKKCYIRTFDPAKRAEFAKMEKDGQPFAYDIFIALDRRASPSQIFIGVPFSTMALEVFGRIHQARPETSFQYHRPDLDKLVRNLQTPAGALKGLRTEAINWLIAGDSGRCDQITLRGNNVAYSNLLAWLNDSISGNDTTPPPRKSSENGTTPPKPSARDKVKDLKLTLRRVELCYDDPAGRELLRLSLDRFGNYTVWVSEEGANLPIIFDVVDRLRKRKLLVDESEFPVRDRRDAPRLR